MKTKTDHQPDGFPSMEQLQLDAEPLLGQMRAHPDHYQQSEKIVDDPSVVARLSQRPEVRVGVMGYPDRASAELGRQIGDDIVNNLVARITKIEDRADGRYKPVPFIPAPLIHDTD